MGFRVHAVGATISVDAPRERWKAAFAAQFEPMRRRRGKRGTPEVGASAPRVSPVAFQVPAALEPLVESVHFSTSAASPQLAGICALLKQVQPGLSPKLAKSVLKASARDVTTGTSNNGQPAAPGHDGATGAGLVNATVAYGLARSVQSRPLFTLPPPR